MLFTTPKFTIQGVVAAHKLAWRPQLVIASVSIEPTIMAIAKVNAPGLTGARSHRLRQEPERPVLGKGSRAALYRRILKQYAPSAKATDVYNWSGMTVAWTMAETLAGRAAADAGGPVAGGPEPEAATNPFLLPGITIRTSPTNYFPLANVYLYRYDNAQWVRSSGLLPAR